MGVVITLFLLLKIPAVQRLLGTQVSQVVGKKIGSDVQVGRVGFQLPNRIILDDFLVYDQSHDEMLKASRVSASVSILPLMSDKIVVTSAQLFGLDAHLVKETPDSPFNFQFVLDSLKSDDNKPKTPLDLSIHSLIIRNGSLSYDVKSEPDKDSFCGNHVRLTGLSSHIILNKLTDNSLDLKIKRLSFAESKGFAVKECTFSLVADTTQATIPEFDLRLPQSNFHTDSIQIQFHHPKESGALTLKSFKTSLYDTKICPSDFSSFIPSLKNADTPYMLSASATGSLKNIVIPSVQLHSDDDQVRLQGNGHLNLTKAAPEWFAHIDDLHLGVVAIDRLAAQTGTRIQIPATLMRLGSIGFVGDLGGDGSHSSCMGNLVTDAGDAELVLDKKGNTVGGRLIADELDINRILDNDNFGLLSADLLLEASLPVNKAMTLTAKGKIDHFDYKGYAYHNINVDGTYDKMLFDGKINMDDANGLADLAGKLNLSGTTPVADISGTVRNFNPHAMHIVDKFDGKSFDFDIKANVKGNSLSNVKGTVDLTDFFMRSPDDTFSFSALHLDAYDTEGDNVLDINSDFGELTLQGRYDLEKLSGAIQHIVKSRLPNLPFIKGGADYGQNDFTFTANLTDSRWMKEFFNIDITLKEPLQLDGAINANEGLLDMTCGASRFIYNDAEYQDFTIQAKSNDEQLTALAAIKKKQSNGRTLDLGLKTTAAQDLLHTDISFDNHGDKLDLRGALSFQSSFFVDSRNQPTAHITIHPSEITINDTIWNIEPSDILVSQSRLMVDHFEIGNNDQHLAISGNVTREGNDSIIAVLDNIDVANISDILHVNGVDFGGFASGQVALHNIFSEPEAQGVLNVRNFQFEDGYMGELALNADWNKKENAIHLNALADAGYNRLTDIKGYIQLSPGEIDLHIDAYHSPLEFLERFCGSFMDNIDGDIVGNFRIFGPLSAINLEGKGVANGEADITPLNTHYTLHNDMILIVPDHLIFNNDTVYDHDGHIGLVSGSVNHHNLKDFTYSLNMSAQNMLVYDHKDFGDQSFCGTVYATGTCQIEGKSGEIFFDIEATPNKNTVFVYNAASPDALSDQAFIQWHDATVRPQEINVISSPASSSNRQENNDVPSDMRINFLINAVEDATLRVIMDSKSDDYIELNGSGVLRASYFNKGAFTIFGNYLVDHGIYKLTIQNVIKREFLFQPGGGIYFGGDPYEAALDLKAMYTANSVPLSDLNIGSSFASNNIRVNCLMNINGTPAQPTVDFDLELPTMSSDAQEMVRSLINSEEELNQQVIYLLTIGRFYNQDTNEEEGAQSRTSLAMQSLLSGTISQQINSLLGNFINTHNWNFGANISTGDEGWNNAEYEGLLSGRLLNNRLLINGQFGYRDNQNATTTFIGDFDIQYLLLPNGNLAINVYNQSNDRYFIKNSLNTQGVGFIMKKNFNGWRDLIGLRSRKNKIEYEGKNEIPSVPDSTVFDRITFDGNE